MVAARINSARATPCANISMFGVLMPHSMLEGDASFLGLHVPSRLHVTSLVWGRLESRCLTGISIHVV